MCAVIVPRETVNESTAPRQESHATWIVVGRQAPSAVPVPDSLSHPIPPAEKEE